MRRISLVTLVLLSSIAAMCPPPKPPTPPPTTSYRLQVYIHTADDQPLLDARLYRDNVALENPFAGGVPIPVGPDSGSAWDLPPQDLNVCGLYPDHRETVVCAGVHLYSSVTVTVKLGDRPPPPPPPHPPLPPIPTRDQLIDGKNSFQGLYCDLPSFGRVPFTDGIWTSPALTKADRDAAYTCKRNAGDQIATFNVSWAYRESGVPFNVPGADLTNDLSTLRALVREAIEHSFLVEMTLAGDGMSHDTQGRDAPIDYAGPWVVNDPIGDTYGWQWLMHNFQRVFDAFGPTSDDVALTPYMRWRAGYDGMVAWQPWQLTDRWLLEARQVIGNGVLVIELPAGFWAWSGEADDYSAQRPDGTHPGWSVDVVQYEFPIPLGMAPYPPPPYDRAPWDPWQNQVLQIAKRMLGPQYRRPSTLPSNYDPGTYCCGPLASPTPRGRRSVHAYEIDTYEFSRGRISQELLIREAQYLQDMGWPVVSVPSSFLH